MNTLETYRPSPTLADLHNHPNEIEARQSLQQITEPDSISKEQWHELAGCGFSINSQLRMLKQLYYKGAKFGQSTPESLKAWVKESNLDIKGFVFEYLQKGMVLPNPVEFKMIDGQKRIAGKNSDRPLLDSIDPKERFGTVKNTFRLMEQVLQDATPGSMMVMTSPDGYSGLVNDEGAEITYPDSQTIAMRKNDQGLLESFTFVTDMDFSQNKGLLRHFGVKEEEFTKSEDQKVKIADVTSKAILLDGEEKSYQFEDVVGAIKKVKNSPFSRGLQSFDIMYERLENKDKLTTLSQDSESLIKEFEEFVLSLPPKLHAEHFEMVGENLARTILKLSSLIRGGRTLSQVKAMDDGDFRKEHQAVAAIGGCGGGGYSSTAFGGRSTESGNCPKLKCEFCKYELNDFEVKMVQIEVLNCCPKCDKRPSKKS